LHWQTLAVSAEPPLPTEIPVIFFTVSVTVSFYPPVVASICTKETVFFPCCSFHGQTLRATSHLIIFPPAKNPVAKHISSLMLPIPNPLLNEHFSDPTLALHIRLAFARCRQPVRVTARKSSELKQTTRREAAFGVDTQRSPLQTTTHNRCLHGEQQLQRQKRLAGATLSNELRDCSAGDPTAQEGIEHRATQPTLLLHPQLAHGNGTRAAHA
jgi:hypothetical protein